MSSPSASFKSSPPHSCTHLQSLPSREIFPFLFLPAELRQQIYSYLLVGNGLHKFELNYLDQYDICTIPRKDLDIRLVCRQIHEEMSEFIFERAIVSIFTSSIGLLEEKLKGKTLPEGNWRRIRRLSIHIGTVMGLEVNAPHVAELERFLKKYFPPDEEGKVKLKELSVVVPWGPGGTRVKYNKLPDGHPLFKWVGRIEGLKDTKGFTFNGY